VARLAGSQHGVVSVQQLREAGLTKDRILRRVEAGRLHPLLRGVYAVGHRSVSERGMELAAVLACGPGAVLSHRAAARLWALIHSVPVVEVTAVRSRVGPRGVVLHRSRSLEPEDRAVRDGVPVTSVARTLVDLADVLSERRLAEAVHQAEVQRMFDLTAVRAVLARLQGRRGRHRLRKVLAAYRDQPFTRSEAERRFLRLCSSRCLPLPATNTSIEGYEVDFFWPQANVAVEVDGVAVHHTVKAFHDDRERDRILATHGIQVLRITWRDLEDELPLARQLAAVLTRC
jgi:very-short-patch-repair endonuclease